MYDINQLRNGSVWLSIYSCVGTKSTILTYEQVTDLFDDLDDIDSFDVPNMIKYYENNL